MKAGVYAILVESCSSKRKAACQRAWRRFRPSWMAAASELPGRLSMASGLRRKCRKSSLVASLLGGPTAERRASSAASDLHCYRLYRGVRYRVAEGQPYLTRQVWDFGCLNSGQKCWLCSSQAPGTWQTQKWLIRLQLVHATLHSSHCCQTKSAGCP